MNRFTNFFEPSWFTSMLKRSTFSLIWDIWKLKFVKTGNFKKKSSLVNFGSRIDPIYYEMRSKNFFQIFWPNVKNGSNNTTPMTGGYTTTPTINRRHIESSKRPLTELHSGVELWIRISFQRGHFWFFITLKDYSNRLLDFVRLYYLGDCDLGELLNRWSRQSCT